MSSGGLSNSQLKVVGLALVLLASLGGAVARSGMPAGLAGLDLSHLTAAVVVEAVSWAALPIYAWLLWSGFVHTRSVARYGVRLAVLAVLSEVPYDLATSGRVWDMSSQNPVFALLIGLVVLAALGHLRAGRASGYVAVSVVVCVAAVLWLVLFNVGLRLGVMPGGVVMLAFTLVFSFLHRRENTMMAVGGVLGALALVFPAVGLLVVHFRNGTVGWVGGKYVFYAAYPACLLAAGLFRLAS